MRIHRERPPFGWKQWAIMIGLACALAGCNNGTIPKGEAPGKHLQASQNAPSVERRVEKPLALGLRQFGSSRVWVCLEEERDSIAIDVTVISREWNEERPLDPAVIGLRAQLATRDGKLCPAAGRPKYRGSMWISWTGYDSYLFRFKANARAVAGGRVTVSYAGATRSFAIPEKPAN